MPNILAEYGYVMKLHGYRGDGWDLEWQALMTKDGKDYDCLCVKLKDGTIKKYYFDFGGL